MIREERTAALVAVGDELLRGDQLDTNSGWLSSALAEHGIDVQRALVLPDRRAVLARSFYELCSEFRLVIACGGLGPTLDDVTREAAADAAGVVLVEDQAHLERLRQRWQARGEPMPESNARQALFPLGAQVMPNACGTAPGFRVWIGGGVLAVLPGPPHEMQDMFARQLLPWLLETTGVGPGLAIERVHLAGIAESAFADRAGDWMVRGANPEMGVTAKLGVLEVAIRAKAASPQAARERARARAAQVRARFAAEQFDAPRGDLAQHVLERLRERGLRLALAESMTGGLIAQRLTTPSGASAVFEEGWVTYSNAAKRARLGVPREELERHGPVSEAVARAMLRGVLANAKVSCGLAITGAAGPSPDERGAPPGLFFVASAVLGRERCQRYQSTTLDRHGVRTWAANCALNQLRLDLARDDLEADAHTRVDPPAASGGAAAVD